MDDLGNYDAERLYLITYTLIILWVEMKRNFMWWKVVWISLKSQIDLLFFRNVVLLTRKIHPSQISLRLFQPWQMWSFHNLTKSCIISTSSSSSSSSMPCQVFCSAIYWQLYLNNLYKCWKKVKRAHSS